MKKEKATDLIHEYHSGCGKTLAKDLGNTGCRDKVSIFDVTEF